MFGTDGFHNIQRYYPFEPILSVILMKKADRRGSLLFLTKVSRSSGSPCTARLFLQFIAGRDNARLERSAGQQLEPDFLDAAVEYRFSAAQDDWTDR